jgi:hypothetical protein
MILEVALAPAALRRAQARRQPELQVRPVSVNIYILHNLPVLAAEALMERGPPTWQMGPAECLSTFRSS